MRTLEMDQAGSVAERVQRLEAGEEVVLTHHDLPVARLLRLGSVTPTRCCFGFAKGWLRVHDDFEQPLEDFDSYTQ